MCRFLLVKLKKPQKPEKLLKAFSLMAKKSRAYDGDWQGDGWGISWLDKNNFWQIKKSLSPIWEDRKDFYGFSTSRIFTIHARSASFLKHKGKIEYNQPFIDEPYVFVFNGLLKGVNLSTPIPGEIGAQKIWSLLQKLIKKLKPEEALKKIKDILLKSTHEIQALNIGLSDKEKIYALCYFSKYPKYYQLQYLKKPEIKIICSENLLEGSNFKPLKSGKIISL